MTSIDLKARIAECLNPQAEVDAPKVVAVLKDCLSHIEEQESRVGEIQSELTNWRPYAQSLETAYKQLQPKLTESDKLLREAAELLDADYDAESSEWYERRDALVAKLKEKP